MDASGAGASGSAVGSSAAAAGAPASRSRFSSAYERPLRPEDDDAGAAAGAAARGCAAAPPRSNRSTRSASAWSGRTRLAARQAHQRDLEDEPRIGSVGAAHVDDGLAEGLQDAHEHRCTHLIAQRGERLDRVVGRVDPDADPAPT